MIARQEYNINTDNKKICEYLASLIEINNDVKKWSLDDTWRIDYQIEFEHTDEYKHNYIQPDRASYYNLLHSVDTIANVNYGLDYILQKMNEEYKCDQVIPLATEKINNEKEDTLEVNYSLNRLIDKILTVARYDNAEVEHTSKFPEKKPEFVRGYV